MRPAEPATAGQGASTPGPSSVLAVRTQPRTRPMGTVPGARRPVGSRASENRPTLSSVYRWAETWAPTAARALLGLVLAWFGYHELVAPGLWTGYVPLLSPTSNVAEVLVLLHGWALLVLAAALIVGVAPRLAAAVAALLLLQIVASLAISHGFSDLVLRDIGVLGLSLAIVGQRAQRLLLRR